MNFIGLYWTAVVVGQGKTGFTVGASYKEAEIHVEV